MDYRKRSGKNPEAICKSILLDSGIPTVLLGNVNFPAVQNMFTLFEVQTQACTKI